MGALPTFIPPPHRLEELGIVGGVRWINDSKATNPAAVVHSVTYVGSPLWLLAGGEAKGGDFSSWKSALFSKIRALLAFGRAAPGLVADMEHWLPVEQYATLRAAVERVARLAKPGDVVLLSPGCASYDEFGGYAERGEAFGNYIEEVERWKSTEET